MLKLAKLLVILAIIISFPALACTLKYGDFGPAHDPLHTQNSWEQSPVRQALSNASHCQIIYIRYFQEQRLAQDLIDHKVDLGILKDFYYYLVTQKNNLAQPLVVTTSYQYRSNKITPYYNGYILTLKNNNIHTLADLKNKKMGFLSGWSTSGFIIPVVTLKDQQIDYQNYFSQVKFYKNDDDNLYQALGRHEIDAIATWDDIILRNPPLPIKVLKEYRQLPNPPLVLSHPINPQELQAMQQALIKIPYINNPRYPVQGYALPVPHMYEDLFKIFARFCNYYPSDCQKLS